MVDKGIDLNEARKQIKNNKKVEDYKFKNEGIGKVNIEQNITNNPGNYGKGYEQLIKNKILNKKDKKDKFIQDVIKHRKQILQPRMVGIIELTNNKDTLAKMEIHRLLIENEGVVRDNFLGQQIEPYTINTLIDLLYYKLQSDGVRRAHLTMKPLSKKQQTENTCRQVRISIEYRW